MSNSAMLVTRYLPARLKQNLAIGLEAQWERLWQDRKAGYAADNTKGLRDALISDARQAFALGLITYLPTWARFSE